MTYKGGGCVARRMVVTPEAMTYEDGCWVEARVFVTKEALVT